MTHINARPDFNRARLAGSVKVSIIVLNFNGERIVGKCLDHLLAQTYPNFEVLVVDNGSSDHSVKILQQYLHTGKVSVVCSRSNTGVSGGRNLGLLHADGEVVAFMDNDGYAAPDWLEQALAMLESDARLGAVASVVFFAGRKIVLNGAGATLNYQGYGGDMCFNVPYEFAEFPDRVLYPMGCGMVVRKSAMERIGRFDAKLFNYYDDAELGIRLWQSGYEVAVAPAAWIDHDFNYSDRFFNSRAYLCERNRIRTVLKYYPLVRLPLWLIKDFYFLRYLKLPGSRLLPFKAWGWNLIHLPSLFRWRLKFGIGRCAFWRLMEPSWGEFPPPTANNAALRPDPRRAGSELFLDGDKDLSQLNFGWHWPEIEGSTAFRWTELRASAFFRFDSAVKRCGIEFRSEFPRQQVRLVLRRVGENEPKVRMDLICGSRWERQFHRCRLSAGDYELLVLADRAFTAVDGRRLAVAISALSFD